jgi:hypothetical protein
MTKQEDINVARTPDRDVAAKEAEGNFAKNSTRFGAMRFHEIKAWPLCKNQV